MYRFCRITDLGKSYFNFSSKNYSSKVYTCFVKVVVLVIQSTAKLGLQFVDFCKILYGFYKPLDQREKLEESFSTQAPRKF
jgi:hypothetical protein